MYRFFSLKRIESNDTWHHSRDKHLSLTFKILYSKFTSIKESNQNAGGTGG